MLEQKVFLAALFTRVLGALCQAPGQKRRHRFLPISQFLGNALQVNEPRAQGVGQGTGGGKLKKIACDPRKKLGGAQSPGPDGSLEELDWEWALRIQCWSSSSFTV